MWWQVVLWIITFSLALATEVVYVRWMHISQTGHILASGLFAGVLGVLGLVALLIVVDNRWTSIPEIAGVMVGASYGTWSTKRKHAFEKGYGYS